MIGCLFLVAVFIAGYSPRPTLANSAQNVRVNCMDIYVIKDPERSSAKSYAGHIFDESIESLPVQTRVDLSHWNNHSHVFMLRNKTSSPFLNATPIQIVRTISPDGGAAGTYECAIDANRATTCSDGIALAPHVGKEQVAGGDFYILDKTKSQLVTINGVLELPHVVSFTPETTTHNFYGMQIVSAPTVPLTPGPTIPVIGNSLKLGTFPITPTTVPSVPNGTSNCVSIYWDPFGRVIDAQTLEPVQNVHVTLKNIDKSGALVLSSVPGNPLFKNPYSTNTGGFYTFAVDPGTYFLYPSITNYRFPVDAATLQNAITQLKQMDPLGQFVDTTNIYNNSQEPIHEEEPESARRDMLLLNTSAAPAVSRPAVINAVIGLNNNNQVISGIVSHPKSVVTATVNGVAVAQTTASMNGHFQLTIASNQLNADTTSIDLSVKSSVLTSGQTQQTSNIPYHVTPVPVQLGGFVYNNQGLAIPNAQVQIMVPALNNTVFTSIVADTDGFISIPENELPPFPYKLQIRDATGNQIMSTLSVADFQKINTPYYQETKTNIFKALPQQALLKPAPEVVVKIKTESARYVRNLAQGTATIQPTVAPVAAPTTNGMVSLLLMTLGMVVMLAGIVFVIFKLKKPGSPFDSTQSPLA